MLGGEEVGEELGALGERCKESWALRMITKNCFAFQLFPADWFERPPILGRIRVYLSTWFEDFILTA